MKAHKERLLMRVAIAIGAKVMAKQSLSTSLELPTATWRQSEVLLRRMYRARRRGWLLAAVRLQSNLCEMLYRLRGEVNDIERFLNTQSSESGNVSVIDIYADLIALDEEFPEVSFDRQEQTLSVTTEPIELEGIFLGCFEIRLDWSDMTGGHAHHYRVLALDPNPAASNDSVTHPHVQDEAVCEGEGREPIRNALKQGRLLDFFVIVANLLRTYNRESPYVLLSDWYGVECSDCGSTVCDDERWTCEKCETTVCGECHFNCPGCEGIFCSGCMTQCESCNENLCVLCIRDCSGCRTEQCQGCLDNNERCSDCHDQETQEERDQQSGSEDSSGRYAVTSI